MKHRLVVMVKEPRPGRVKTRLGRDIGLVPAAWWFRHQTRALLRRLEDPRWGLILAVSPDAEGMQSRVWPAHLPRIPQGRGTLGDRMARILRDGRARHTCIIGADIPGIKAPHIAEAFAALGRSDLVFGPAPDGGYWLVGLRAAAPLPRSAFDAVRWSSAHALADTEASLRGLRLAYGATLRDVDGLDDLRMTAPGARAT